MDIHKPKPWRGWREFIKEIGTIVIGVLIALGAEQGVEWLHHRAEVAEARRALDAEVGYDLAGFDFSLTQRKCLSARLGEIARWRASFESGRPLKLALPLPRIPAVAFRTSVWRVASVAAVAQMPFEARVGYGKFYDGLANAASDRSREGDLWNDLSRLARARVLSDEQLARVDDDIDQMRAANESYAGRVRFIPDYARALKVTPSVAAAARFATEFAEPVAKFCRPLLPTDKGA